MATDAGESSLAGTPFEASPIGGHAVTQTASTANSAIDALLSSYRWAADSSGQVNLTFSFASPSSVYLADYGNGEPTTSLGYFNDAQKNAVRSALTCWAKYANVTFTEVSDSASVAGDIRFGMSAAPSTAWAYLPGSYAEAGDVWIGYAYTQYQYPVQYGYGYATYLHEIGHALGLKHPHSAGGLGTNNGGTEDTTLYSIMSYRSYAGAPLTGYMQSAYANTPMLDDVAAIQALYGANTSYNSGNTTYSWTSGARVFECLWDGGGVDRIDWSNQSSAAVIDLNPGTYSQLGPGYWNGQQYEQRTLAIAYGCSIENATGGTGNDTIRGNSLANVLDGKGGNDTLDGGSGADTLIGGDGNDAYIVDNTGDVVSENGAQGTDSITTSVNYTLSANIENLKLFGAATSTGSGNGLANNLEAYGGSKTLLGLAGNDSLLALGAANTLDGGEGDDVLTLYGTGSTLIGRDGGDSLGINGSSNVLYGGDGSDYVGATGSSNALYGDAGGDNVFVFGNINLLDAGSGDDFLACYGNANTLYGQSGGDVVGINGTSNTLFGGPDNDVVGATGSSNFLYGEAGNDNVFVFGNLNLLDAGSGDDFLACYGNGNALLGRDGGDAIGINGSNNTLHGGIGGDVVGVTGSSNVLFGDEGDDRIFANGSGNTLIGGTGNDVLSGDVGADRFMFASGDGSDVISNFTAAQDDKIVLSGYAGVSSFGSLQPFLAQTGSDVTITLGLDHITLQNVLLSQLTATQFTFG
jgi:Ca2+-binding RTX toxin-like protein